MPELDLGTSPANQLPLKPAAPAPAPAPLPAAAPTATPPASPIADLSASTGLDAAAPGTAGGLGSINIPGLPMGFVNTAAGTTPSNQSPVVGGSNPNVGGGLGEDPWTALQQQTSADVQYLRSPLEQTTEGQAQLAQAKEVVNSDFDTQIERLRNEWGGASGAGPNSGVLADLEAKVNDQRNRELSDIDRQWAAQTGTRLAQSQQETGALLDRESARQMQAAALETSLTDQERQALADEAALAAGQTLAPAANTAADLATAARSQAELQAQEQAALGRGLGALNTAFFTPPPPTQQFTPAVQQQEFIPQTVNQPGDIFQGSAPAWWDNGAAF